MGQDETGPGANDSLYTVHRFVTTQVGEPYLWLPIAHLRRLDGDEMNVTPDLARRFKLPNFHPPIKRGSHADDTAALGHIVDFFIRDDGIYVVPEWTEEGIRAVERGDYRYHSPEIIWEDGVLEDVINGHIEGPIIMGDALLHTPALGGVTAFYSADVETVEDKKRGVTMSENTVNVPTSVWDKVWGLFSARAEAEPEPAILEVTEPAVIQRREEPNTDEYDALQAKASQVDELSARVAEYEARIAEFEAERQRLEAERKHGERVAHFAAEFTETVLDEDTELHELLAGIDDDEQAAALLTKFKALAAQAKQAGLEDELGAAEDTAGGADTIDAAVKAKMQETGLAYPGAFEAVRKEQSNLFE